MARSLRTRRTNTIGLLIPSLDNVGFADVTHGIQQAAAKEGKLVLLVETEALSSSDQQASDEVYERLVGDGLVDGLIVAFADPKDRHVSSLAERGIPLVLVNRRSSGISGSVVVDDLRGSRMAVEHLASLGHQRIAFIGLDGDFDTAQRRRQGYRDAMADVRLTTEDHHEQAEPPTVEGGREGIERLLAADSDSLPTAIFVASLMSSLGVRAGLMAHGLRIPEDVSLIAFNDHPIAEHLDPALTTVRMPNLEMGQMAVQLLLKAIDGQPVGDVMVDLAPRIIERASTAAIADRSAESAAVTA